MCKAGGTIIWKSYANTGGKTASAAQREDSPGPGAPKAWAQDRVLGQQTGPVDHFPSEASEPAVARPLHSS